MSDKTDPKDALIASQAAEITALKRDLDQAPNPLACMAANQQIDQRSALIATLTAQAQSMREALEKAPHDSKCPKVVKQHLPGYMHYETDYDDPCPAYHFGYGTCDCWKSAALTQVSASPKEEQPK